MKLSWMIEHKKEFATEAMCRTLSLSRSGYHAAVNRQRSGRQKRREELAGQIAMAHRRSRGTYGSPRICAELNAAGVSVCENTVAKVMKQAGIRAKKRRRLVPATTDAKHPHPVAPNKLDRDFAADAPNQKWLSDITYIPTGQGWLYLATTIDAFSRKVVGWSMADHLRVDLVADALSMAPPDCCTTPTAACSTPAMPIRRCWPRMDSSAA